MRIDLLTTELRTGGAERCLTELALGLRAAGDQVRVLSLAPLPCGNRDQLLVRLLAADIEVKSAGAENVWALRRTSMAVRRWLEADRPQVLQTFLYHGNMVGTLAGVAAGVPVRVGGVRVAQPRPWRWWAERVAVRRMQGLVCVSQAVEEFARRRLRPPAGTRVVTIPNGVRVEAFSEAKPRDWATDGIPPGSRVVLFVGRWHRQKGLDLLLRVAPELLKRHPDAAIAIVGAGPMQSQVQQAVGRLPPGRAIHLPWQADVAGLYAGAEAVVVPSRYEGMPNVVLEAMAAARPVVAAEVEGVAELLGGGTGPQTFPPGDSTAMLERISGMLQHAGLQQPDPRELGRLNQQRAIECFSVPVMVQRYRRLYEQLAADVC